MCSGQVITAFSVGGLPPASLTGQHSYRGASIPRPQSLGGLSARSMPLSSPMTTNREVRPKVEVHVEAVAVTIGDENKPNNRDVLDSKENLKERHFGNGELIKPEIVCQSCDLLKAHLSTSQTMVEEVSKRAQAQFLQKESEITELRRLHKADIQEYKDRYKNLQKQMDDRTAETSIKHSFNQQLEEETLKKLACAQQLEEEKHKNKKLHQDLASAKKSLDATNYDIQALNAHLEQKNQDLRKAAAEVETSKNELETEKKKQVRQKQDVELNLRREFDHKVQTFEEEKQALKDGTMRSKKDMEREIKDVRAQYSKQIEELQAQTLALNHQIEELRMHNQTLEQDVQTLEQDMLQERASDSMFKPSDFECLQQQCVGNLLESTIADNTLLQQQMTKVHIKNLDLQNEVTKLKLAKAALASLA